MDSPTKRRKRTETDSKGLSVRNLDYFFAPQNAHKSPTKRTSPERGCDTVAKDIFISGPQAEAESQSQSVTDEELARRLQREWNETERNFASDDGQHIQAVASESAPQKHEHKDGTNVLALRSASAVDDTVTLTIPFDESPLVFEPAKHVSDLKAIWDREDGSATYSLLTRCFVLVNSTQSRIKIVDTLTNLLRTIIVGDPESLLPTVWLSTNAISPSYVGLELGLGGSAISKALKKVCGLDSQGLKSLYNKHGDAGDVAFEAKKRQTFTLRRPKPLTIKSVFNSLVQIANSKGTGSQEVKQRIVERLIQDARGAEESRYIVRTLVQHLRIGAVKTTMLIALSRAFMLSSPPHADFEALPLSYYRGLKKEEIAVLHNRAEELVKASFARRPNYSDLVPALLSSGVDEVLPLRCGLALHIPLRPMLGSITRDLGEVLVRLHDRDFTCEYKYDGQRAQIHCDDSGKVTIFSRHLEVMTDKYPDLVAIVPQIRGDCVKSFILEGEVVAIDSQTGELRPFQTLSNRARKEVEIGKVTIDVCLFAFDLMYLNGSELLDRPFRERRGLLRSLFQEVADRFTWVRSVDVTSSDSDAISQFFKEALAQKCEGIMVKVLDNAADIQKGHDETSQQKQSSLMLPASSTLVRGKQSSGKGVADQEKPSSRRKALLATYEPDKRLESWLKVKKDYDSTAADTLDLIPVAGWHGQGRKSKWWSPILMAVRNSETGGLQAVTKCISGFTDKFYESNRRKYDPSIAEAEFHDGDQGNEASAEAITGHLLDNTLPDKPFNVEYGGHPDVWFRPQEVWEMAFADITLSPTYTAAIGLVSEDRGLSLRFPRFLRVRDDKGLDEASDADYLAELWHRQGSKAIEANEEAE